MLPYTGSVTQVLPGGETTKIVLPVPNRATLKRLIVKQTDGATDGFSFDLLDREDACLGEQTSSTNLDDGMERLDREMHKLQATQTVAPASDSSGQFGLNIPYANRDEQSVTLRQPTRALYLDVTVGGSGEKRFQVAFTVEQ